MIKIDDLVKQRLNGAEEKERPGAWLQMRDMLDQKLPVSQAVGYNWKRMFTAITGIVLLASLTVGGFRLYTTRILDNEKEISLNTITINSQRSLPTNNGVVKNDKINQSKSSVLNEANNNIKTKENLPKNSLPKNNIISQNSTQKNKIKQPGTPKHKTILSENIVTASANIKDKPSTKKEKPNNNSVNNALANGDLKTSVNKQTLNTKTDDASSTLKNEVAAEDRKKQNHSDKSTLKNSITTIKDSLNTMNIRTRSFVNPITQRVRFISDTISIGKVAMAEKVPIESISTDFSEQSKQINPFSSLGLKEKKLSADNNALVPLSNYKVESRKTNAWDAQHFNEVVKNVKFNLAQTKFYPGLLFGVNSNLYNSHNIMGLQIGVTGLFSFGENWNMLTELKYIQRINNGGIIRDNYNNVVDSFSQNNEKVYVQNKVEHFFKFSALHSLEMPIAVRYAMNRFHAFGGLNMVYNFKVNPEEITRVFDSISVVANNNYSSLNTEPGIKLNDFGARFSLGYLLGVGYQVSPALQFDIRMTQNLWDNTRSNQVSQQLFRMKSFQLSLGYRFSQKNKIPKAK